MRRVNDTAQMGNNIKAAQVEAECKVMMGEIEYVDGDDVER
jgi:hypothetical protein